MREILFRGKRVDNGEWVYGNLVLGCEPQYVYIVEFGNKELCRNYVSIIPETVGQYIGFTDKNGNKIFEEDVVLLSDTQYKGDDWKAVIVFGNPNSTYSWGWQLKPISDTDFNTDILCWIEMEDVGAFCEVIGNIYDNPKLIESEVETE